MYGFSSIEMSNNLDRCSAKILVLGDSGVGKSSLIYLICHSAVLNSAQWTIGCSIDVKLHDNYFLEFWDIGGSRSHKIARSFLYQDYHGIILVFDATNNKSRTNLNEWLVEVMQKTNDKDLETSVNINVPIITIATKKDLLPYGTLPNSSETTTSYNNQNSSVVNISESPQTNLLYRRQQSSLSSSSSSYSLSPLFSSFQSLSTHSPTNSSTYLNEPVLENPVIYVNTQDALSIHAGSKNYEKLNNFFKHVINRRNKKVYNKFAI